MDAASCFPLLAGVGELSLSARVEAVSARLVEKKVSIFCPGRANRTNAGDRLSETGLPDGTADAGAGVKVKRVCRFCDFDLFFGGIAGVYMFHIISYQMYACMEAFTGDFHRVSIVPISR